RRSRRRSIPAGCCAAWSARKCRSLEAKNRHAAEPRHPLAIRIRMAARNSHTAAALIPAHPSLGKLRAIAAGCTACPLYAHATQTVFGEGPAHAALMLVGETAGDQEDLQGRPFVGPSGKLLGRCLEEAGLDRKAAYVTNVVKHFKFVPRGKKRVHG